MMGTKMKRRNSRSRKSSKIFQKTKCEFSKAVFVNELNKKEVLDDEMKDIMTDECGYHHCRICDHTFNTKSSQHWIPQWLSHRQSKRHQNNRSELLKKIINAEKREKEKEKPKKQKKRLKLTLNKSSKHNSNKNRYKVRCPHCDTCNALQIHSTQNFQLKNSHCVSKKCNKEYWIQIKDNEPIITKKYPFTTGADIKLNLSTLNRKRKKGKQHDSDAVLSPPKKKQKQNTSINNNMYYKISNNNNDNELCNNNNNNNNNNMLCNDYNYKMSHSEIMNKCCRSMCSDFISGDSHCWEAKPIMLPGNIEMSQIGYNFICVWCSKEICFVDNSNVCNVVCGSLVLVDDDATDCEIEHQSSEIESTLSCVDNIIDGPSYSRVPSSLNDLKIKDRIMASDGTHFLEGWIEKIDKNKVLIHFKGWNNRWDRWYNIKSGMLKTLNEYRKDRKIHSATRNEDIYHVMNTKYPSFVASNLLESIINNNKQEHIGNNEVINAEIVMMHDKNETFMALHELPIYGATKILSPPLFCETDANDEQNIIQIVCKCFAHLSGISFITNHIMFMYKCCESKLDELFFTLYVLKQPDKICAYIKLLNT